MQVVVGTNKSTRNYDTMMMRVKRKSETWGKKTSDEGPLSRCPSWIVFWDEWGRNVSIHEDLGRQSSGLDREGGI